MMTYGYHAEDAAGNQISRAGLTAQELRMQHGNLVVCGYMVVVYVTLVAPDGKTVTSGCNLADVPVPKEAVGTCTDCGMPMDGPPCKG